MMRKICSIFLLGLIALSCEKDDVCAETVTTPKVIIEFFEFGATTETVKNVTNLHVTAPGFSTGFDFNGTNKVTVPLKTFQDFSQLQFILNGSDTDTSNDNLDELTFNYTRTETYVSRGCGFKTTFLLNNSNGVVLTPDASEWIKQVTVIQTNIQNENETHIKIFF